jgi:hypothetical protein
LAESRLSESGISDHLNDRFREKQTFKFWFLKNRCGTAGMHPIAALEMVEF